LQKLEDLGYLQKNTYGEYITKNKAHVRGHIWIGRRMLPKMLVYALIFMSILIVELIVLAWHYEVEDYEFKAFFLLLTIITGCATGVFIAEGLLQRKRTEKNIQME
jgi:polyferredoxin